MNHRISPIGALGLSILALGACAGGKLTNSEGLPEEGMHPGGNDDSSNHASASMAAEDTAARVDGGNGSSPVGSGSGSTPSGNGSVPSGSGSSQVSAPIEQALMDRWNAVVDEIPSSFHFHWSRFDQFPHPTFQGGSREAYGEFADNLLAFFQRADDFDFLAEQHLFRIPLQYVFASGMIGVDTTFEKLARDFSSDTAFGNISDGTRAGLKAIAAQIAQQP